MAQIEVKIIFDVKGGVDPDVVRQCATDAGLHVERVIPAIGAIFGSCEESVIGKLKVLKGVVRVAPEGRIQLPPTSSNVPQ